MPHSLKLDQFGDAVWAAFGQIPYHVGSSLLNKAGWRDVDVRLILSDEDWDAQGYGDPAQTHMNGKWVAMCLAFSELGKAMTGLPIDFQIQRQTEANAEHEGMRSAIGLVPNRYKASGPAPAGEKDGGM